MKDFKSHFQGTQMSPSNSNIRIWCFPEDWQAASSVLTEDKPHKKLKRNASQLGQRGTSGVCWKGCGDGAFRLSNTLIEPSPTSIMVSATHPWEWNNSRVVDSFPGKAEWKLSKTQKKRTIPFLERKSYTYVKHGEMQICVSWWVDDSKGNRGPTTNTQRSHKARSCPQKDQWVARRWLGICYTSSRVRGQVLALT